jgi:hypothetical protein
MKLMRNSADLATYAFQNSTFQCFQQLQWLPWNCQALEKTCKTDESRLIPQCQEDASTLHHIAIQLPEQVIANLFACDSGVGLLLFRRFTEVSRGQGWPFEYTDKIGDACRRFARASGNIEVKVLAIATALEVGVSHNRYAVMDAAAHLINSIERNDEAVAVGHLVDIEERLDGKKLHPIVRELLEQEKKARATSGLQGQVL